MTLVVFLSVDNYIWLILSNTLMTVLFISQDPVVSLILPNGYCKTKQQVKIPVYFRALFNVKVCVEMGVNRFGKAFVQNPVFQTTVNFTISSIQNIALCLNAGCKEQSDSASSLHYRSDRNAHITVTGAK